MIKSIIRLDASNWTSIIDFYEATLKGLGAPPWHGRNINALIDSMVWGGINKIESPYTIKIQNTGQLPSELLAEIMLTKQMIEEGRTEAVRTGREVEIEIVVSGSNQA